MKKCILILSFYLVYSLSSFGQTLHYFEFTTSCGHGNWEDTSFIAATDDAEVIENVLADLSKPYDERRFITGNIDYGDGGFNHNADHWFLWHFIPGEWDLAEMAIELCDGCPYSDVDADTAYWIGTLGYFCPWSGKPAREIAAPTSNDLFKEENWVYLYPNPGQGDIVLEYYISIPEEITLQVYSMQGDLVFTPFENRIHESGIHRKEFSLPKNLPSGNYLLMLSSSRRNVSMWITK